MTDKKVFSGSRIDSVASVAMIAAAVALIWKAFFVGTATSPRQVQSPPPLPQPGEFQALDGAAMKGSPTAKGAIIVYSDFECPFCSRFATEVMPQLQAKYLDSGSVVVAFRHFPLAIHPHARVAAEMAECAGKQGRFWEMHDFLFQGIDEKRLKAAPIATGLRSADFETCMGGQVRDKVQADLDQGNAIKISGTPTFFLGSVDPSGKVKISQTLVGGQEFGTFQKFLGELGIAPASR